MDCEINFFIRKFYYFLDLMRITYPIGFFLLLWPTFWGLWVSNKGQPEFFILIKFFFGVLCTRSAGCIINDYIDCNIDKLVERTKNRPLSVGIITKKEALMILVALLIVSAILVLTFNINTVLLAIIAFFLSGIYPYLKRYTYFPQFFLGVLFSSPILIGYTAITNCILCRDISIWCLFLANFSWTIAYDTQYAILDRDCDKNIGVKSFAVFCENMDTVMIGLCQVFTVSMLWIFGYKECLSKIFYFFALGGVTILFVWQQILMYKRKKIGYLRAFLNNGYVGMLIFVGIACHYY